MKKSIKKLIALLCAMTMLASLVTIVAADATTADAYATWCMVVGLDKSKEFLDSTEGFEGCLIYDEDGKMKTWCSKGFAIEIL